MTIASRLRRMAGSRSPSVQQPVLQYHDITLYDEDIQALRNDWLTDNNIAFWEEWLEREILPQYPKARISLLRPTMAFILLKDPDINSVAQALPRFDRVTHIFLPINDNHDVTREDGGSHWSLLLVSVIDGVAFHYDSLGGANYQEARACTNKLSRILGVQLRMHQLTDCPQQANGMDCGVFVCILMRHLLLKRLLNASASEKVSMSMGGKMIDANGGRREMLNLIKDIQKNGGRHRSVSRGPSASSSTTQS